MICTLYEQLNIMYTYLNRKSHSKEMLQTFNEKNRYLSILFMVFLGIYYMTAMFKRMKYLCPHLNFLLLSYSLYGYKFHSFEKVHDIVININDGFGSAPL